jgi:hypothetical protein
MNHLRFAWLTLVAAPLLPAADLVVDKDRRTVTIPAKVAPRKIEDERFKETYPIEVIATHPYPRGKKAHETVVTIDVKPSAVHKALEELGLRPGKPARTAEDKQSGPEVKIFIEVNPGKGAKRVPVEQVLADRKTGKAMPKVKWHFTGSATQKGAYGADESGTLIAIFPVTAETVFQSSLSLADEKYVKLETNDKLPKVGTAVNLVIVVPEK